MKGSLASFYFVFFALLLSTSVYSETISSNEKLQTEAKETSSNTLDAMLAMEKQVKPVGEKEKLAKKAAVVAKADKKEKKEKNSVKAKKEKKSKKGKNKAKRPNVHLKMSKRLLRSYSNILKHKVKSIASALKLQHRIHHKAMRLVKDYPQLLKKKETKKEHKDQKKKEDQYYMIKNAMKAYMRKVSSDLHKFDINEYEKKVKGLVQGLNKYATGVSKQSVEILRLFEKEKAKKIKAKKEKKAEAKKAKKAKKEKKAKLAAKKEATKVVKLEATPVKKP